jgi:hypothetical protein
MNPSDCVADQNFARCESKTPQGAKNFPIGFSIRSFTRFPWITRLRVTSTHFIDSASSGRAPSAPALSHRASPKEMSKHSPMAHEDRMTQFRPLNEKANEKRL